MRSLCIDFSTRRDRAHGGTGAPALAFVACLAVAIGGCQKPAPVTGGDRPLRVGVGIAPAAFLVQRVGGPHVQVEVLAGPGQSEHTYQPTPQQMAELSRTDLYFTYGLEFERRLLEKLAAQRGGLEVVDLQQGIALRPMECSAEHDGDHDHPAGAPDPHTWLSPRLARQQARTVAAALTRLAPAHRDEFAANLARLEAELERVDARVSEQLSPLRGQEFIVFHPSYGYFADAYGLKQSPIEIEGKEPSARELAALVERARRSGVRVIFFQPQFPAASAAALAREVGAAAVVLDPLAADYLTNLEAIAAKIAEALRRSPPRNE